MRNGGDTLSVEIIKYSSTDVGNRAVEARIGGLFGDSGLDLKYDASKGQLPDGAAGTPPNGKPENPIFEECYF